jgi:hypothetical protein
MCVKVGVTEDVGAQTVDGGATVAEYATWNELGVLGPPISQNGGGKWFIPPRPFVRNFADGKRELIAKTMEKLVSRVSGGKLKAETAMVYLGKYGEDGVRTSLREGPFTPNADSTIAKKGSGKAPLMDKSTLKKSIRYQVIEKPVSMVSEQ